MENKVSNILDKKTSYIKDASISFKSKILRILGYTLIGKPSNYELPNDFYDMPADREMPNPKFFNQDALVKNVKTNNIRRKILAKTSNFAFFILLFLFLITLGLSFLPHKTNSLPPEINRTKINNRSSNNPLDLKDCNKVLDIYYYGNRNQITKNDIIRCNVEAE